MHIIGIDLGTTNSRVGVFRNGNFEIIENNYGYRVTPSIVAFNENGILVGDAAKNQMMVNLKNTIVNSKRLVGQNYTSEMKQCPYEVACSDGHRPEVEVMLKEKRKLFAVEEITSMILANMKKIAEKHLGGSVENAVITVPASFNDSQRIATKDAAQIAGFKKTHLLNDTTAAACAYGIDLSPKERRNILVYNFGSGTIGVSIVTIDDNFFHVKSTAGDVHLGGNDFDEKLVNYFVKDIMRSHKQDISNNPRVLCRLRIACEKAKNKLSFETETTISIELMDGKEYTKRINLARFESLCQDLFGRTMWPVKQALAAANMVTSKIDDVIIVGGSSRMPKFQKLLSDFFGGKILSKSVDTDEAVLRGAAILAGLRNDDASPVKTCEIASFSVAIREVVPGVWTDVIYENDIIPFTSFHYHSANVSKRDEVHFEVWKQVRSKSSETGFICHCVGVIILKSQEAWSRLEAFKLEFAVDSDRILRINAFNRNTGEKMIVENNRMIDRVDKRRKEDIALKESLAAKKKLESLMDECTRALNEEKISPRASSFSIALLRSGLSCTTSSYQKQTNATREAYEAMYKILAKDFHNFKRSQEETNVSKLNLYNETRL